MKCKIFSSFLEGDLEQKMNTWLESNPIATMVPNSFHVQYSMVYYDDPHEHIVKHVAMLFYIPRIVGPFEEMGI